MYSKVKIPPVQHHPGGKELGFFQELMGECCDWITVSEEDEAPG